MGDSKIIADGDSSHEIQTLAPWKKGYAKHSISKSREITLPTKVCLVKAMVFPVVIHGCDSLTPNKAEHQRTDAF